MCGWCSPDGDSRPHTLSPFHLACHRPQLLLNCSHPKGKLLSFWSVSALHKERPPALQWERHLPGPGAAQGSGPGPRWSSRQNAGPRPIWRLLNPRPGQGPRPETEVGRLPHSETGVWFHLLHFRDQRTRLRECPRVAQPGSGRDGGQTLVFASHGGCELIFLPPFSAFLFSFF